MSASKKFEAEVAANILVAETEVTNIVEARGVMPVPYLTDVAISALVGYARGRSV